MADKYMPQSRTEAEKVVTPSNVGDYSGDEFEQDEEPDKASSNVRSSKASLSNKFHVHFDGDDDASISASHPDIRFRQ